MIGDVAGSGGGAIYAGNDTNEVARANLPILADKSCEGGAFGDRNERRRPVVGTKGIVTCKAGHSHVVGVDVLAGRDDGCCKADDLAILDDGGACRHVERRDFMAGGNPGPCNHPLIIQPRA